MSSSSFHGTDSLWFSALSNSPRMNLFPLDENQFLFFSNEPLRIPDSTFVWWWSSRHSNWFVSQFFHRKLRLSLKYLRASVRWNRRTKRRNAIHQRIVEENLVLSFCCRRILVHLKGRKTIRKERFPMFRNRCVQTFRQLSFGAGGVIFQFVRRFRQTLIFKETIKNPVLMND